METKNSGRCGGTACQSTGPASGQASDQVRARTRDLAAVVESRDAGSQLLLGIMERFVAHRRWRATSLHYRSAARKDLR